MKTNFSPDNLESDLCWHTFSLPSSCQGETLFCRLAEPTTPFRAVVQISHGMCEHIDRYLPFFRFLAREGFVICGHDHLGHGKSCQDPSRLGFISSENGYHYLVEDLHAVSLHLKKRYPDAAIRVKIPEEFLMIPMDAVLIEQVTINLLENAIVHSGSILPIDFIVEDHPEHVSFIVRDYGKGLSEEKLQNLFETGTYNNSQSSDSRKGMGIGLSICKTIITAHHGTLSGRNHADGAEFCFTLPKVGVVASEK